VIDPTTGDIYGIIIATAPEAQESYIVPAYQVYDSIKLKFPTDIVEFPASNYNLSVPTISPIISPPGNMEPSMETVRMGTLHDGRFIPSSSSEAARSEATNLSDKFTDSEDEAEGLNIFKPVNPPRKPIKRPRPRPLHMETYVYCCRCRNGPAWLKINPFCTVCNVRHCKNCTYEKR
jgi:hypothetical protein